MLIDCRRNGQIKRQQWWQFWTKKYCYNLEESFEMKTHFRAGWRFAEVSFIALNIVDLLDYLGKWAHLLHCLFNGASVFPTMILFVKEMCRLNSFSNNDFI
jgi:hypothetical protein